MSVELLGYSERGVVNAICEDIYHSSDPVSKLAEFLSWFDFLDALQNLSAADISQATIHVEQGFSDFGDLDLLVLVECHSGKRHAILIEAKVSNDTSSWQTIEDRWKGFEDHLAGAVESTSNLFVQLHRKVRLVAKLRNESCFTPDCLVPRGSLGTNRVVKKAGQKLKDYLTEDGVIWFGAILPDKHDALVSFARDFLKPNKFGDVLPTWCPNNWVFLSWQTVSEKVTRGAWPRTAATLDWNQGQIFRATPPVRYPVEKGGIYLNCGRPVYVVACRSQHCQVVELDEPDCGYFWKTTKVRVADLVPDEGDVPGTDMPQLPRSSAAYIWNSRDELPVLPSDGPVGGLPEGSTVVVKRSSWVTTRVELQDGLSDSFLVYTHQLRRS